MVDKKGMEFDKKLAATILGLIASATPQAILQSPNSPLSEQWSKRSSESLPKTTTPEDVLGHLLVLSHSGLIRPELKPEHLMYWLSKIQTECSATERAPLGVLCYTVLPELLRKCFLTVKGYKFLEEHLD